MRNLPLLLALLLFAGLSSAAPAQASLLPAENPIAPLVAPAGEEEDEAEEEEGPEEEEAELDEVEACEPEEGEPCEEEVEPRVESEEECLLRKASANVTANPGKRRLRLTVHYKALKPATVTVEASLRGSKGVLHLGREHARFRGSGVYRDAFSLPEKQMRKAATARDFEVELHAVNTPPSCRAELTARRDGSKKLIWS
jgi:hypothetical protein